jgi:hypothetical protein
VFDWGAFLLADISLFYRKHLVVPENTHKIMGIPLGMDHMVLFVLIVVTTAGKMACFVGSAGTCWLIEGNIIFVTMAISVSYFDLYFVYKIYNLSFKEKAGPANVVQLYLPVVWTVSTMVICFVGSMMYQNGIADVVSNAYWNIGSGY